MPICLQLPSMFKAKEAFVEGGCPPDTGFSDKTMISLGGPCDGWCGPSSFIQILFYTHTHTPKNRDGGHDKRCEPIFLCCCRPRSRKPTVPVHHWHPVVPVIRSVEKCPLRLLPGASKFVKEYDDDYYCYNKNNNNNNYYYYYCYYYYYYPCLVFLFFKLGYKVVICIMSICYSMWVNSWSLDVLSPED